MRILNLNNFIITTKDEASLKLIIADVCGVEQPPLFYKSKLTKKKPIVDVTGVEWTPTIEISKDGTPEEYCKRVNWWFDNKSDDYKQQIEDIYKMLPDFVIQVKKSKSWLLTTGAYTQNSMGEYFKRKTDINKYFRNWLNKQLKLIVRR